MKNKNIKLDPLFLKLSIWAKCLPCRSLYISIVNCVMLEIICILIRMFVLMGLADIILSSLSNDRIMISEGAKTDNILMISNQLLGQIRHHCKSIHNKFTKSHWTRHSAPCSRSPSPTLNPNR